MIYTFLGLEIKQGALEFPLYGGNMLVECWKNQCKKTHHIIFSGPVKSDIKVGHQGPKFVLWCWFVYLGYCLPLCDLRGFPGGSVSKESACNAGDLGSISG